MSNSSVPFHPQFLTGTGLNSSVVHNQSFPRSSLDANDPVEEEAPVEMEASAAEASAEP